METNESKKNFPRRLLGWFWIPFSFLLLLALGWLLSKTGFLWVRIPLISQFLHILVSLTFTLDIEFVLGVFGTLTIFALPLEILARFQRRHMVTCLIPAWAFLVMGIAGNLGWEVFRKLDIFREFLQIGKDLGFEGVVAINAGLFLIGGAFQLMFGKADRCKKCGAWWSIPLNSTFSGSSSSYGGRFSVTGSGWEKTRTITSTSRYYFRCRKCGHEWSESRSHTRREKKPGPFSSWTSSN